jgi:haloacetate dehalogenase
MARKRERASMFEGFAQQRIAVTGAEINLVAGGSGPPLLCLHGYPQTHVMWHRIAPQLAERFSVVMPDLRGYGDSSKPPEGDDHAGYSKRVMAQDQVEVMAALGHETFFVAGHDRGGRVAYRMAFDHPEKVRKLAILDVLPTWERFDRVNKEIAYDAYHWFFLAQPRGLPETLIGGAPEFYLRDVFRRWGGTTDYVTPEAFAEYLRCFSDPETIRASCADYRAGYHVDHLHDADNRERGDKIQCPVHVLWGGGGMAHKSVLLEIWRGWAETVTGRPIDCGHFLPEEAPAETLRELLDFFGA